MRVLSQITMEGVEEHLLKLGGGNHIDNMNVLRSFPRYSRVTLRKAEYLSLVFLQNSEVLEIAPPGGDRRLGAVAARALRVADHRLSRNWNWRRLLQQTTDLHPTQRGFRLPELLLRDVHDSESQFGAEWYIQDGCHRAPGYAMVVLSGRAIYVDQTSICATRRCLMPGI